MVSLFVETLELKGERSKVRLCPFLFCIIKCMQFSHLSPKPEIIGLTISSYVMGGPTAFCFH